MSHCLTLSSGIRLILDPMATIHSVAVGVFAQAGSRHEPASASGVAHFLEHLFFKGTARRDAYQIALECNALGSQFDAFTDQELIGLEGLVLDEKVGQAIDLLGDMVCHPTLDPEEFKRERGVILDEWMMYEDSPDDRAGDLFTEILWAGHPLGRPVLGSRRSLRAMKVESLRAHQRRFFRPDSTIITLAGAAGALDAPQVAALAETAFAALTGASRADDPPGLAPTISPPEPQGGTVYVAKPLEQLHFCLGVAGPSKHSPDRYAMAALNQILGGDMASRLFQEVREKRGLAYAIGSSALGFSDAGYFAIHGGVACAHAEQTLDLCLSETQKLCRHGVTEQELDNARDRIRQSLLLSQDNPMDRMMRLADHMLHYGRPIPLEETLAAVERLTVRDLQACADRWLAQAPLAGAYIGPRSIRPITRGRDHF